MTAAVIVFPGSNCDRDVTVALAAAGGRPPVMVWHRDTELPRVDLIVIPGGFAYGDYLRAGAMAAHSPIMSEVARRAANGVPVLGICNGFQVLTELGLLPGVLRPNASLKFICRDVRVRVERSDTVFTRDYAAGQVTTLPIAHHAGNYYADADTLARIEHSGMVVFRYCAAAGGANPNGSANNIAGLINRRGNVLGLMPHPERAADRLLGGVDGAPLFAALAAR